MSSEQDTQDFYKLKERLSEFNDLLEKNVEIKTLAAKTEGWNMVLTK